MQSPSDDRLAADTGHVPVLLREAVDALVSADLPAARIWVDGTFGRGGHARELLSRMGPLDRLVVIDRDPEAIRIAMDLAAQDARVIVVQGSWEDAVRELALRGIAQWHGVLLDLGVSSPQLEDARRGFSFRQDGPLDMRMDPASGRDAADWLNTAPEREIADVLRNYGEEREARRIARAIVARRPLRTTGDLAAAVHDVRSVAYGGKHDATRTFQAVRIFVNDELNLLERSLPLFFAGLAPHARLVVISFHSLEDRIVKQYFRAKTSPPSLPRHLPVRATEHPVQARLVGRSTVPSPSETRGNPRARSARMRVLERIA